MSSLLYYELPLPSKKDTTGFIFRMTLPVFGRKRSDNSVKPENKAVLRAIKNIEPLTKKEAKTVYAETSWPRNNAANTEMVIKTTKYVGFISSLRSKFLFNIVHCKAIPMA